MHDDRVRMVPLKGTPLSLILYSTCTSLVLVNFIWKGCRRVRATLRRPLWKGRIRLCSANTDLAMSTERNGNQPSERQRPLMKNFVDDTQGPLRMPFADDATKMAQGEAASRPTLYKAGKTSRLVDTLMKFGELQDSWDLDEEEEEEEGERRFSCVRLRRRTSRESARRHKLLTWHYDTSRLPGCEKTFIDGYDEVITGEQNRLSDFITHLCIGNSRKQLRPLHVEAAVLLALVSTSGFPLATKYIWKYRTALATAAGVSVLFVKVLIRTYDRDLHKVVTDYLKALPVNGTPVAPAVAAATVADTADAASSKLQKSRVLRFGCDLSKARRWTDGTKGDARIVAFDFVRRLSEAYEPLTNLVAQFWDNVQSMTYPICKFEHGKNRYIFRMSTGQLCTGTRVSPKLGLDEIEAGAQAGNVGATVSGKAIFRRLMPDLQVVNSDNAIDCSINVPLGRRRVLGMRERRALRVSMMLASYTKYELDMATDTDGVFEVAGLGARSEGQRIASFTCNSPPDLISLLLCNQIVSSVSRNGITVITGFLFRGHHAEILRAHHDVALFVKVRAGGEQSYTEIVSGLIQPSAQSTPSTSSGSADGNGQSAEWKLEVCGALSVLAAAKSAYLLTRKQGVADSYRLHELTDRLYPVCSPLDNVMYVL